MKRTALIIIDMLNDFMPNGALPNEEAPKIVPFIQRLLAHARQREDWVVVFSNDSHLEDDVEIPIWGRHAMRGTPGANVIEELKPQVNTLEWEEPKRFYSAFEQTPLAMRLKKLDVDTLCLCGQHSNCCVRHSAFHGFVHGFRLVVPEDAVIAHSEDHQEALDYLTIIYGVKVMTSEEILSA